MAALRFLHLGLIISIFALLPHLRAESPETLLDQLKAAMRKEAVEKKEGDTGYSANSRAQFTTQVELSILRGDPQAEDLLVNIANYSDSETVRSLARELAKTLRDQREKRDAAFLEEVDLAVKSAGESVLLAMSSKDLDDVLLKLGRLRDERSERSSDLIRRAQSKLEAAVQVVTRWQDYLTAREMGNFTGAFEIMRSLANNPGAYPIVPRSEILTRAQGRAEGDPASKVSTAATQVELIAAEIRTLEDIEPALKKLRALQKESPGGSVDGGFIDALTALQRTYIEFNAGLSTSINFSDDRLHSKPVLISLKAQLLMLILPRHLEAGAALPDETPVDYLDRVLKESKDRRDWSTYARAAEAMQTVESGRTGYSPSSETKALNAFLAALNQEKARQFTTAAQSYAAALRDGSPLIPAEFIGERLKAIEPHLKDSSGTTAQRPQPPKYNGSRDPFTRPTKGGVRPELHATPTPDPEIRVPAAIPSPTPAASAQ